MSETERERNEREARERDDALRRIPLQEIDKTKWPKEVREIALREVNGLGIDSTGRLYWNGKPVEIVGQRLDLTRPQFFVAAIVAVATVVAALATTVQAWTAYHDWACKANWPVYAKCPTEHKVSQPPSNEVQK